MRGAQIVTMAGALTALAVVPARLVPMPVEPAESLPIRTTVVAADTAHECWDALRYRVYVLWRYETEFEVTCFHRKDVVVKSVHRVPGRKERLLVLAFFGDRSEGGYETQVPVMNARRGVPLRQVRWGPAE